MSAPLCLPPPEGWTKINVDAAPGKNDTKGDVAAVPRSSDGNFLGASSVVFSGYQDPDILEALACQEALSLTNDLLVWRVRVASDCLRMINTLRDGSHGRYAQITHEIIARCADFQEASFCHGKRGSYKEAHILAFFFFLRGAHILACSSLQDEVGRRV